jgi:hypothetical protein
MGYQRHTIRHLDPDLLLEARIFALQTGQRLGDVVNQAIDFFISEESEGIEDTVASVDDRSSITP